MKKLSYIFLLIIVLLLPAFIEVVESAGVDRTFLSDLEGKRVTIHYEGYWNANVNEKFENVDVKFIEVTTTGIIIQNSSGKKIWIPFKYIIAIEER